MVTYKEAGVDIQAGKEAVERIIPIVKQTFNKRVLTGLGLFGSLFDITDICRKYKEPVLVQSIDGVGTKMAIAATMNQFADVGRDLVAHSCNDVLCQGATPLTFLDYVATANLDPNILAELVRGMSEECVKSGVALVGGETAEMPGTYSLGEWDIAGAILGVVEKSKIIDGSRIAVGDVLIGLASDGLHTNGYSLARKVFFEHGGYTIKDTIPDLAEPIGKMLMKPHRNYSAMVLPLLDRYTIHGIAHITGGGLVENIPRILPKGFCAHIQKKSWDVLPIFTVIQRLGEVPDEDMYRAFNMGIGLVLVVPRDHADNIVADLARSKDVRIARIGEIAPGKQEVCFV